ncbi:hypothetical protein AALM99_02065 [Lactococcus muris]|uniref:Uncharacterized protein n=1 Tax=Lactococcus muris TaxID=2941330 RepID=A0ABV4D9C1_9LACT|nr:hypothetical protein [Lactococcus garvieae]
MSHFKDVSTLIFKNYPEVNFILWFAVATSTLFPNYFLNFMNVLFLLSPKFLQNYFLNIHIPNNLFHDLYLSLTSIFMLSFLLYFFGDIIRIYLSGLFFKDISQESNMTAFFEKFIILLSLSLLGLHILNVIINIYPRPNFITLFGIEEFPLIIGKTCSWVFGFYASQLNSAGG